MTTIGEAAALRLGSAVVGAAYAGPTKAWPLAKPFSPLDIPGCSLWLDAGSLGLADGAEVWSWADSTGLTEGVYARVGVDNPSLYVASAVGGQPAVRFSGGQFLFSLIAGPRVGEVFAVAIWDEPVFSNDGYNGLFTGGTELILLGEGDGSFRWYPVSATYYLNGANSTGTRQAPVGFWAVSGLSFATAFGPITPTLGIDRFVFSRFWRGAIAELLTYDHPLSAAERDAVSAYLMGKYGIAATRPVVPPTAPSPKGG